MSYNSIAQEFVSKIAQGVPLQDALAPSLVSEADLRRLFATDRSNPALNDPVVGLADVFAADKSIRLIQARRIPDPESKDAKYVFPLKDRRPTNTQAMAESMDQFRTSFNIFTEGAFSQFTAAHWNNVVVAGGAVLASLLPLPTRAQGSKRAIRKYFHEELYSTSDIDLFLYDLTPEQAEKKAIQIYEAVRDAVPWDTVCVRTKHAISIHSQFPYRPLQIILRLYKSPAEILAGFDIDCACFLYDGTRVMGNPRAITALMSQSNLVDMTRRSPSYEVRLAKYALRGFEVHVPALVRQDVDPTIYERSINRIEGLARLLVLEKLSDPDDRTKYLEKRRQLRGRPEPQGYSRRAMRRRRKVKGDLKAAAELFGGVNTSDYGTQSFHIPYGPGFDSKKVEKLIYSTDLGMNSTFNPKNKDRRLHRHPAFFGSMEEVLEDCCEYCPDPISTEEQELQVEEDKQYVRGRVEFLQENPGQQGGLLTGSFNPINDGEWAMQAYLGPVEKFFRAIAENDLETVGDLLEGENGFDLKKRDHLGRTALHLAIMVNSEKMSNYLIDSGARITARLVDGRTPLHLASQLGMADIVSKLLERSKQNEKKAEEEKAAAEAAAKAAQKDKDGDSEMSDKGEDDIDTSEDDWESGEENDEKKDKAAAPVVTVNDPPAEGAAIPDDNDELPDILDVNAVDWDFMYSPLSHAIVAGHLEVVDVLLRHGVDLTTPFKKGASWSQTTFYPLTLTLLTEDKAAAAAIAEKLLENGATCTSADESLKTVFHQAVLAGSVELVRVFIKVDPHFKDAINFLPQISWNEAISPLTSSIGLNNPAMAALLLSSGASAAITEEMFDKSWEARHSLGKNKHYMPQKQENQWLREVFFPLEAAMAQRSDIVIPLIQLGCDLNRGIRSDNQYSYDAVVKRTVLDVLRESINSAEKDLREYKRLEPWMTKARAIPEAPMPPKNPYADLEESNETLVGFISGQVKRGALQTTALGFGGQFFAIPAPMFAGQSSYAQPASQSMQMSYTQPPGQSISQVKVQEDPSIPYEALIVAASTQLEWMKEVEQLIVANGGKTARELNPSPEETQPTPQWLTPLRAQTTVDTSKPTLSEDGKTVRLQYKVYRSQHYSELVGAHLTASYAELFEACWEGDTQTIERLCLPPKSGKRDRNATYLQVAAEVVPTTGTTGYSTLAVAIMAKHWDTAKAIISISKAQYQKEEEKEKPYQAPVDSDDSDYDSDMSVDDYEEPVSQPQLVDLANRLSTVKTSVGPEKLFASYTVIGPNDKFPRSGTPLNLALEYADVQTFEQILALGEMCDPPITMGPQQMESVIKSDEPALLNSVIRKFGFGLPVKQEEDEHEHDDHTADDEEAPKKKKTSKTYLGLNVQGRKRKDLATKGDPDAPTQVADNTLPLVWQAAQLNSHKILTWLTTAAPLEAYRAYMEHSKDEAALAMKRIPNFDQQFRGLIGATVTDIGEHVVLAHLTVTPKLETLRLLFSLYPDLKTSFVHNKLQGLKMTSLHYVCDAGLDPEIFDFFIQQGSDPVITDHRGCNIMHMVATRNHIKLLKHMFTRLDRNQLALLLSQPTNGQQNTPLHLAVTSGSISTVECLLSFDHPVTNASISTRDADGSLPIHIAITKGYKEIVELLLGTTARSLFAEDGLGSTPLEQAEFRHMLALSNKGLGQSIVPSRYTETSPRVARLEDVEVDKLFSSSWIRQMFYQIPEHRKITPKEVGELDITIQNLDADGRFVQQPALKQVLDEYIKRSHTSAGKWAAFEDLRKQVQEAAVKESQPVLVTPIPVEYPNKKDSQDLEGTWKVIRDAVMTSGTRRRRDLVHLLDAQRAVNTALKAATKKEDENHFDFPNGYNRFRYGRRSYGQPADLDLTTEKKEVTFQYSLPLSRMNETM